MKILVTGGAGFIGSHISDALVAGGHELAVIDNLSSGKRRNLNEKARFYKSDIRSRHAVERVFKKEKPDILNHHAAQIDVRKSVNNPAFDASVNVLGTINLLECCVRHGVKKVIFASSGGVMYGETKQLPCKESMPAAPFSPYGVTKRACELYLHYYKVNFGLDFVALRYGNVYGPRQDPHGEAGVVAIFINRMLRGDDTVIFGNGRQTRDYVFVGDVARASVLAMEKNVSGIFNVGTGIQTSVNRLFGDLKNITSYGRRPVYAPPRKGELQRSCLDAQKARARLRWKPRIQLAEGLSKTVESFREGESQDTGELLEGHIPPIW